MAAEPGPRIQRHGSLDNPVPPAPSRVPLYAVAAFIALAYTPIVYWSAHTPFALIDDYSDFQAIDIFSPRGLWNAVAGNILNWGVRYRFGYDIVNTALTWKLFGANATLHHLFRLSLKFVQVFLLLRLARRAFPGVMEKPAPRRFAFAVAAVYALFSVVAPESRLGPQEPVYTIALLLFLLGVVQLAENDWLPERLPIARRWALYLSYFFLTVTKETAIVPAALLAVALVVRRSRGLGAIGLWGWSAWTILRIGAVALFPTGSYSEAESKGIPHVMDGVERAIGLLTNSDLNRTVIGLMAVGLMLTALPVVAAARVSAGKKIDGEDEGRRVSDAQWFLVATLLGHIAFFAYWKYHAVRYLEPAVALTAVLLCAWAARSGQALTARVGWVAFLGIYVLAGLYPLYNTYATQYRERGKEARLLVAIEREAATGATVRILDFGIEHEDKIRLYLTVFRPRILGLAPIDARWVEDGEPLTAPAVIVSRVNAQITAQAAHVAIDHTNDFVNEDNSPAPIPSFLEFFRTNFFDVFGQVSIRPFVDAGAPYHQLNWFIHRVAPAE